MPERKKKESKSKRKAAAAKAAGEAEERAAEPAPEAEAAEAAEPAAETEFEADQVARLEAEVALLKDQLLRALAETENLRRRSEREREKVIRYAAAPVIKDLIGVADNLRRAMDSVAPEALENDEHLRTLMAGLEMTEKELAVVFERHHIVKIDPLGERLDPHYHEAMFEIPDPETPSGTVLQVLQAGYRLYDRLLRPAQVGVAKGGPAPAREAEPEAVAEDAETTAPGPAGEPGGGPEPVGGNDDVPPGSTVDTSA